MSVSDFEVEEILTVASHIGFHTFDFCVVQRANILTFILVTMLKIAI